jgi:hypothetical protein
MEKIKDYEKIREKTKKSFKKSQLVGTKSYLGAEADQQTKSLFSNNLRNKEELEFLFNEFKKQGLIPEFIQDGTNKIPLNTPEDLKNYVEQQTTKQLELKKLNKPNKLVKKEKGINPINRFKTEVLNNLIRDEARNKLELSGEATEEALESIENLRWQGLPLAVDDETGQITWAARQLRDKVPQAVIDFGNTHEIEVDGVKKKAFPEGAGDKWAKWARKSWEDMRLENQTFRSIFGFDFDRGHWIPSAWGGPNTKRNASAEAARDFVNQYGRFIFGNRDKKDMPNLSTMHAHRELGGSATWLQDFIEWQLDQEGLNANQLPESHWLSHGQNALVQDQTLNPSELSKKGIDINRETGLKQQQVATRQLALQTTKLNKLKTETAFFDSLLEGGLIPEEDKPEIEKSLKQIKSGEWYNREDTFGKYGDATKATDAEYDPISKTWKPKVKTVPKNNKIFSLLKNNKTTKFLDGFTSKTRRIGGLGNVGLNIATGNVVGTVLAGATYGTSEALKNPIVQKRVSEQLAELVAKRGSKTAMKLIPGLDILISGGETWDYLMLGRWDQAGIAAISGAIGWLPIIGDGASAALDLTNLGLDIARLKKPSKKDRLQAKKNLDKYLGAKGRTYRSLKI